MRPRGGQHWRNKVSGLPAKVVIRRGPLLVHEDDAGSQFICTEEAFVKNYEPLSEHPGADHDAHTRSCKPQTPPRVQG